MAITPAPLSPVPVGQGSAGVPPPNPNTQKVPPISNERQRVPPDGAGGIMPVDNPQKQRLTGDRLGKNE